NDNIIEPQEAYTVTLNSTTDPLVPINDGTANGIINDDDNNPGVTGIAFTNTNVIVTEGSDAFARFTVTITGNISENVTVDYVTNNGTAMDGSDMTTQSGTITFTPTVNSFDIDIPILNDNIIEPTEEFTVVLSNIQSNLGIGFVDGNTTNTATGTINDDDDSDPSLGVQFDITSIDVNEDAGTVSLDVVLNADVQDEFTVEYHSTAGTATDAFDYTGIVSGTQTLTFGGANANTQTITIPIIDDVIIEDTEDFNVILSNISTTLVTILTNDTATVNIIDNDGNEGWPEDMTIEACDTIPPAEDITSTSACTITVVLVETVDGDTDSCPTEYTITRTWTITDCVGNVREHVQIITIEDTIAPTFVEALPTDMTVQCDSVPDADVLTAIDSCEPNMVVDFAETITDSDSCPSDYIITRTWTVSDCAGNNVSHTQTIIVEDTVAPTFVEELPQSMTVLCNEVPDAVTLTAIDNCDSNIVVDFTETTTNDANCLSGYTVTRVWTTIDCAGNTVSHTQIITIEPTGPITASDYEEEVTILCGEEIPPVPELTFMGGCGNYTVVFNEVRQDATDGSEDFMLIRTWNVTDSCGNTASFEQIIFVFQPQLEEVTIDICIEDEAIDLINYLPESFDTNGTFEVLEGDVTLNGSLFDPLDHLPGEYKIAYSSIEGDCKYYVDFTIVVNTDCVPCSRDQIEISEAVTANGDGINDYFEIRGVEFCQFTFDVEIFNRWGDKVYEAKDYQNDWNGSSPSGSFGSSGVLPSGTYYYVINAVDNELGTPLKPFNGFIYLGTK
ncbi:Calx-beta domain-containing protein, partial [Croceitalea marina]